MAWGFGDFAEEAERDFPNPPVKIGGFGMEPSTLALINAGSSVLGKALGSSAGPSRADSGGSNTFDHSGFVVDFGPGDATSMPKSFPWWILPASLLALGAIVWAKKKS